MVTGKPPTQSTTSSSKASLTSGVNGLVTLSSAVTQSSSHTIAMTTTTPSLLSATASSGSLVGPSLLAATHVAMTTPSLLAASASSSSLVGPSSVTTATANVSMTTQSSFPTQAALSQQQYKLQQQQQHLAAVAAAAAADAETKRLFANGAPHIMQVNKHPFHVLDAFPLICLQVTTFVTANFCDLVFVYWMTEKCHSSYKNVCHWSPKIQISKYSVPQRLSILFASPQVASWPHTVGWWRCGR